jgi:ribokinase
MSVCVIGSLNLDIVCRVEHLPRPGETVAGHGVEHLPGGKGANQAIAAALSGAPTRLIGAVGPDEAGAVMLAAVRAAGVGTDQVLELAGETTGHAFIWVSAAGENSIVVAGGANAALTPNHVDAAGFADGTVFLAQLETPVVAIEALFASPAGGAGTRILNAAPAEAAGRTLFALTDILIVNETELARYAGLEGIPTDLAEIEKTARRLISRDGQIVIVTLGAAGAMAIGGPKTVIVPGRPARVVDTTGAGDCFCGALAARLSQGADLDSAMLWANAAAALSTERLGAGPSMPTQAQIEAALNP